MSVSDRWRPSSGGRTVWPGRPRSELPGIRTSRPARAPTTGGTELAAPRRVGPLVTHPTWASLALLSEHASRHRAGRITFSVDFLSRRPAAARQAVEIGAVNTGCVVGAPTPPAFSTVTAISTDCDGSAGTGTTTAVPGL